MGEPDEAKLVEWRNRAAKKNAIVPKYFEVFPNRVILVCGACETRFVRNLVPSVNEPTFVCPKPGCQNKNWVPVRYEVSR
jgi:hypothetical protein